MNEKARLLLATGIMLFNSLIPCNAEFVTHRSYSASHSVSQEKFRFPFKQGSDKFSIFYKDRKIGDASIKTSQQEDGFCMGLELNVKQIEGFSWHFKAESDILIDASEKVAKPLEYRIMFKTKKPYDIITESIKIPLKIMHLKIASTSYKTELFFDYKNNKIREISKFDSVKESREIENEGVSCPLTALVNFFATDMGNGKVNLGKIYAKEIKNLEGIVYDSGIHKVLEIELPERTFTRERTRLRLYYSKNDFVEISKFELYNYSTNKLITANKK